MSRNFKKIIDLVKKNKERVVLFDSDVASDGIVVMTLEEYTNINSVSKKKETTQVLTENNLIDNINKDIAVLVNNEKSEREEDIVSSFYQDHQNSELDDFDNLYYYNDNDSFTHFSIVEEEDDNDNEKKIWNIPVDIQEGAE